MLRVLAKLQNVCCYEKSIGGIFDCTYKWRRHSFLWRATSISFLTVLSLILRSELQGQSDTWRPFSFCSHVGQKSNNSRRDSCFIWSESDFQRVLSVQVMSIVLQMGGFCSWLPWISSGALSFFSCPQKNSCSYPNAYLNSVIKLSSSCPSLS